MRQTNRGEGRPLRIAFGVAGGIVLLIAPFLSWRDFTAANVASAQLRGVRSPDGREVLAVGVICILAWMVYPRISKLARRHLSYAVTVLSLMAFLPLIQFSVATNQLETLTLRYGLGATVSGGFGLALAFLGDVVAMVVGLISAISDTRRPVATG